MSKTEKSLNCDEKDRDMFQIKTKREAIAYAAAYADAAESVHRDLMRMSKKYLDIAKFKEDEA